MNEFVFEQSPWEAFLNTCKKGSVIPVLSLLTMLENENDEAVEAAFQIMADHHLSLDLSQLPPISYTGVSGLRMKQEREYIQSGLSPAEMEENDPLRLYLEELSEIPVFGDEQILAEKAASCDEEALSALTQLGLSRVVELACEYSGYGVLLMDLIQEGNMGLWEAIQCYHGGDYFLLRDQRIHHALAKAVFLQSRSVGLGQKMQEALQDYKSTDEMLLSELGRNPSLEEIADRMHISPDTAETIRKLLNDTMLTAQSQKAESPVEEEPEDDLAVEDTAYFQMRQRIEELLSHLSREDARLLSLRFGLEKGRPLSPEETGRKMGMTAKEVMEREAAALAKLRN